MNKKKQYSPFTAFVLWLNENVVGIGYLAFLLLVVLMIVWLYID
jgi:hypothetical protein